MKIHPKLANYSSSGIFGEMTIFRLYNSTEKSFISSDYIDTDNNGVIDYVRSNKKM